MFALRTPVYFKFMHLIKKHEMVKVHKNKKRIFDYKYFYLHYNIEMREYM